MNPTDENHFDRLSDDLLRCIFNKLLDAKTLTLCLSVSKRFASILPQTDTVSLSISPRNSHHQHPKPSRASSATFLKTLINKFITKPLQFLHRITLRNSETSSDSEHDSYYSPTEVLKSFNEIRSLQIQLPCHDVDELGSEDFDSLLKWKAEFGSQLESCVVLGATSFQRSELSDLDQIHGKEQEHHENQENEHSEAPLVFTNEELKLRVVWTISSLIAASARHYMMKQIVKDRPMLRNVVITDAHKQGKLYMREEQIMEMRKSCMDSEVTLETSSLELERSRIPALKMKLWYVPVLELPASGCVMKGATLVVIRTVDGKMREGSSDGELFENAFDGVEEEKALDEAVREILKAKKKRTYTMEMDSF